ncbi:MAG TPA: tyrosine--tRNA ligase [Bacteroidota bacterium]|nr:tyrosine--tRNA ligase [Bacteroidota bacterium]
MFPPLNEQLDIITRGTSEIIRVEDLERKISASIRSNTPLKIKLGCDPSRPDLHLGHSVVLRKLRQFQDLGHEAILIVGDFTGMIGDPSGRNKTRPPLSLEETRANGQSYFAQAARILSSAKVRMLYNSEWLGAMSFADVIGLASKYTVARMLERDDFERRYGAGEPISMHEFLYPLAQAMDSVATRSDVELGGTDQKFNLLVGRDIQREYGIDPQVTITMPILAGTDGVEKMSKSLDNYIGLSEPPREIFGKSMRIPDALILDYFILATDIGAPEIASIRTELADPATNPSTVKRKLARTLVTMYHSAGDAAAAESEFNRMFRQKESPETVEEAALAAPEGRLGIIQILVEAGLVPSRNEARRMVEQGAVSVEGTKITDPNAVVDIAAGVVVRVGKRGFRRVRPA